MPRPAEPLTAYSGATPHPGDLAGGSRDPSPGGFACTDYSFIGSGDFEPAVARALQTTLVTVLLWRKRFIRGGPQALLELSSGARPPAADHLTEGTADCGGHQEASAGGNKALERTVPGTSTAR